MEYQLNCDHYHRFDVMEVGKLPARSYFIPFSDQREADAAPLNRQRVSSSRVQCLSGTWDFLFYSEPGLLPEVLDTEELKFDSIAVPGCWQFQGYGKPFYINTRYQYPFDPPHIPKEEKVGKVFCTAGSDLGIKPRYQTPINEYNYVGVYRKKFTLGQGSRHILSFLGVASCLDLYVNGHYAGYSEGSHNMAEFDITDYAVSGENELLAVVRRWCTGTYLECQDMFRNNGIFRDVLLHSLAEADIWDVRFESRGDTAKITAWLTAEAQVKIVLSGHGLYREVTLLSKEKQICVNLDRLEIQKWTAETPVLYDLYLQTENTCVKLRVGFRDVQIRGDVFTLNGRKLKLKGVNHHDTNPRTGYTMTPEEIEADVRLCKQYNIDTIRTSHYPPDPLLLQWCDELGIYVVDEADLETHGCVSMQVPPNFNTITHDKKWENRYLDRVQRLFERDKNHSCVIMWSLGNEAGGYRNTDAMYGWLKQRTALPVHYESVIHTRRTCYDVGSEMYPTVEMVCQVGEHARKQRKLNDRPYFMCEYAHAMGVGPGAVEEYWQQIYAHDNLMGGCVWEMVDHAVLHEDGSYTYGGDHGEWAHDSNFCVDGLFYPDRSPSTGAKIIRHVYRPIRIRHLVRDVYEVFNTMAFTGTDCFRLTVCTQDGKKRHFSVAVPPMSRSNVRLPGCEPAGISVYVCVEDKRSGRIVSKEQLAWNLPLVQLNAKKLTHPVGLDLSDGTVKIHKDGKTLTVSDPYTILYRVPTDNDRDFFMNTRMDDFIVQQEEILGTVVAGHCVKIETRITCRKQVFLCTDTYEQCEQGILVTSQLQCLKGKGNLPRFGKAFRLESSFDSVSYLGREGESYCDMVDHAMIRQVDCTVRDMTEPNIKPQESGNRCDCSWVKLSDGNTEFAFLAVDKPFELGIKPYRDRELLEMRHRWDEARSGTYITLSVFQMGIGTGSCGPATLPKYSFDCNGEYTLRFVIQ